VVAVVTRNVSHFCAFQLSDELTLHYRRHHEPGAAMISFLEVVELMTKAKIGFVLMGTHGIVGWRSEPRATQDVDLLINKRQHKKAIAVIQLAYPELIMRDTSVVTRFWDPVTKKVVIDLMRPEYELYRQVFRNTFAVANKYRIPDLEMSLACKYAAMRSETRRLARRHVDAGDFIDIVEVNLEIIDLPKLKRLANLVEPRGGTRILQMIEEIKAGRLIQFLK
jgi:hypothetical protein